jgi:hypothetical protein
MRIRREAALEETRDATVCTDTGFVVDDYGEPISFSVYVLDCSS